MVMGLLHYYGRPRLPVVSDMLYTVVNFKAAIDRTTYVWISVAYSDAVYWNVVGYMGYWRWFFAVGE